jgi:hypothetical protein
MKRGFGVLVFAAAVYASASAAFAQAVVNSVSDAICPAAIAQIKTLSALGPTGDPGKISDAARSVVQTYNACTVTARAGGALEPYMHYDEVRAAQYGILLGRALFAQKDYDGAHAAFVEARRLSTEVAQWVPPSMGYTMNNESGSSVIRNGSGIKSRFYDTAVDIRKAADVELAKLVPVAPAK